MKDKGINTSWDPLSKWYSGMVGEEGSKFHQHTAVPTVLELLDLKKGDNVLDIGCGNGFLSQVIFEKGANYTGVDPSFTFVKEAKQKYSNYGKFYQGDAVNLNHIKELEPQSFDAVVFLLSIQDMDPLEKIIKEAAGYVRRGGKMVIFMTHPAFRIPRQSGWGFDPERNLIYRRVDRYLTASGIPLNTKAGRGFVKSYTFHRPLQNYINALAQNGLLIERFLEIPTYKVEVLNTYNKQERKAYGEFPLFLAIRAVKQ